MRIVEEDSTTTRAMFERIDACLKRTCWNASVQDLLEMSWFHHTRRIKSLDASFATGVFRKNAFFPKTPIEERWIPSREPHPRHQITYEMLCLSYTLPCVWYMRHVDKKMRRHCKETAGRWLPIIFMGSQRKPINKCKSINIWRSIKDMWY